MAATAFSNRPTESWTSAAPVKRGEPLHFSKAFSKNRVDKSKPPPPIEVRIDDFRTRFFLI